MSLYIDTVNILNLVVLKNNQIVHIQMYEYYIIYYITYAVKLQ